MPELPDLTIYIESLEPRITGQMLQKIKINNPFLLRTYDPPIEEAEKKRVKNIERIGKQIIIGMENDIFLVFHLMIAGRFLWKSPNTAIPGRIGIAAFYFAKGTLFLTEAGKKRRASLHIVKGRQKLDVLNSGGLEVLDADLESFHRAIIRENHTLKRALTDPRLFAGIGNAYSDEILHTAGLSPLKYTSNLTDEQISRLYTASRDTLLKWIEIIRQRTGDKFPTKVTAFRNGMAVHGRYGKPCPTCGTPVQRIVYSENECNYCPTCQTSGKIFADRALSRLLRGEWPRSVKELEGLHNRLKNDPESHTTVDS
jgi:formamidopyrimidine-DNA glycosylase